MLRGTICPGQRDADAVLESPHSPTLQTGLRPHTVYLRLVSNMGILNTSYVQIEHSMYLSVPQIFADFHQKQFNLIL